MPVAKIVELVGSSKKGWDDAVKETLRRSHKTIRNVRGIDLIGQKAVVENGEIVEYRVVMKVSFVVED